jgi:hypothetical protein
MLMTRLAELSSRMPPQLKKVDRAIEREIIRAVIQRIEVGPANIAVVLRPPPEMSVRDIEPVLVTLSRVCWYLGWPNGSLVQQLGIHRSQRA